HAGTVEFGGGGEVFDEQSGHGVSPRVGWVGRAFRCARHTYCEECASAGVLPAGCSQGIEK
ncbi:hypothetical protein, partial [Noviherbaspirillum sp.]|uniref:hypothetical protein n=1 Tax=Noviherbaspirillum sp. TaxID=1926288 RepID=UPI002D6AA162